MNKVPKELEELFKPKDIVAEEPKEVVVATKKGRTPKGDVSVKDQVLDLFQKDTSREWNVASLIERLKVKTPDLQESSVRATVTALQKTGQLVTVRKEGRSIILRLAAAAPVAVSGATPMPVPGKRKPAQKASGGLGDDLEVLRQAAAVIEKYRELLEKLSGIL